MEALFITGTDTGVGKTTVTAGLCAFLSLRKHLDVGVMKPFESGLPKTEAMDEFRDSTLLRIASGSGDAANEITPYTFDAPLSPYGAAKLENRAIDRTVLSGAYDRLLRRHDILVVEGAGGVLVPITKDFFFSDLIKAWDIPTIIVARLSLGTINHTLLTSRFLQAEGIDVLGVILNDTEELRDPACETNPTVLRDLLNVPFLGVFPHMRGGLKSNMDRETLAETFAGNIDTDAILDSLARCNKNI